MMSHQDGIVHKSNVFMAGPGGYPRMALGEEENPPKYVRGFELRQLQLPPLDFAVHGYFKPYSTRSSYVLKMDFNMDKQLENTKHIKLYLVQNGTILEFIAHIWKYHVTSRCRLDISFYRYPNSPWIQLGFHLNYIERSVVIWAKLVSEISIKLHKKCNAGLLRFFMVGETPDVFLGGGIMVNPVQQNMYSSCCVALIDMRGVSKSFLWTSDPLRRADGVRCTYSSNGKSQLT
jgi:hypothetical protein